jgi:putative addiction module component (TIGR02574 family)
MSMPSIDISQLSPDERLALIRELWDSLEASDVPLTPGQEAELNRRLATLDHDIAHGSTWEEIEAELDRRQR